MKFSVFFTRVVTAWQYTGGEGSFAGITGGGTFKTKVTSATTLEATWEGAYELAGARAKAV